MKIGDTVDVFIHVQNDGGDFPNLTSGKIAGFTLDTLINTSNVLYQSRFIITNSGVEYPASSDIPVNNLQFTDNAGNASNLFNGYISQNSDTLDAKKPVISNVTIPNDTARIGDVVTATITVGNDGGSAFSFISGEIGAYALTNFNRTSSTSYTATFTVTEGGNSYSPNASVPVTNLIIRDLIGNLSDTYAASIVQAEDVIDAIEPSIDSVVFEAGDYNADSIIDITIYADQEGHSLVSATINGQAAENFNDNTDGTYSITYTIQDGDQSHSSVTTIPISIELQDSAGNTNDPVYITAPTSAGTVTIDAADPQILSVSIPNAAMKIGDTIVATITVSDDGGDFPALTSGTIANFNLFDLQRTDSVTYTAKFEITNSGEEYTANSTIPVANLKFTDGSGNTSNTFNGSIIQSNDPLDAYAPDITAVSIPNVIMNVGDEVVVTLTTNADRGFAYDTIYGTIAGFEVYNLTRTNQTKYKAYFTVSDGGTDYTADADIPYDTLVIRDNAGNLSAPFSGFIVQANDPIDANIPVISNVTIPNDTMLVYDTVIATITVSTEPDSLILISGTIGNYTLFNFEKQDPNTYTALFTIPNGGTTYLPANNIPVSNLVIQDSLGNTSSAYNASISQVFDPIFASLPLVTLTGGDTICDRQTETVTLSFTGTSPFRLIYTANGFSNTLITASGSVNLVIDTSAVIKIVTLKDNTSNINSEIEDSAVVFVHDLPVPSFSISPTFNNEDEPVDLSGTPPGGTFEGEGVAIVGGTPKFHPQNVALGTYTIYYHYTDGNGCSDTDSNDVEVTDAKGTILNLSSVHCYDEEPITLIGINPDTTNIKGTFTIKGGTGLTDIGNNRAIFNPTEVGPGNDTITYSYVEESATFEIIRVFKIDSVGTDIDYLVPNNKFNYCLDDNEIELTGVNLYPSGGTGSFTGQPGTVLVNKPVLNRATFFPEQVTQVADSFFINYQYTSPDGCKSQIVSKKFIVNVVPTVTYALESNYNINGPNIQLIGNPAGGTFSGSGVTSQDSTFRPGNFTSTQSGVIIRYSYTNLITGCSSFDEDTTDVRRATGDIENLVENYCYSDTSFEIKCVPEGLTSVSNPFYSSKGSITALTDSTAIYDMTVAKKGIDTIRYTYFQDNTEYEIVEIVRIDSVGIIPVTLGDSLNRCEYANDFEINASPSTKISTGSANFYGPDNGLINLQNIAIVKPTLLSPDSTYLITYEYVSNNGECIFTKEKKLRINARPELTFDINDNYSASILEVELNATPSGGTYSSNSPGLTGTIFSPSTAGAGANVILTYTYTDANTCVNTISDTTLIISEVVDILTNSGKTIYCSYGESDIVRAELTTGYTAVGFDSIKGLELVDDSTAVFYPRIAGPGEHIVDYRYLDSNLVEVKINRTLTVDSSWTLQFENLQAEYCVDDDNVVIGATHLETSLTSGSFTDTRNVFLNQFDGTAIYRLNNYDQDIDSIVFDTLLYVYTRGIGQSKSCYDSVMDYVQVNPLPDVSFTMKSLYNVTEVPDTLQGVPAGGIFTGSGISSDSIFVPVDARAVEGYAFPFEIQYKYTDVKGCADSVTFTTNVDTSYGSIISNNPAETDLHYCYYGNTDILRLTGVSAKRFPGSIGTFTGPAGLTDQGNNTASINPKAQNKGEYLISYEYLGLDGVTKFTITDTVFIDSVENEFNITGLSDDGYCEYVTGVAIQGSPVPDQFGNKTFYTDKTDAGLLIDNQNGNATFNPVNLLTPGSDVNISYIYYKNFGQSTVCRDTVTQTVRVHKKPDVDFTTKSIFNVTEPNYHLKGNYYPEGSFSSTTSGVIPFLDPDYFFDPQVKDLGKDISIKYTYTDSNACVNDISKIVTVQQSQGTIISNTGDADFHYCNDQPELEVFKIDTGAGINMFPGTGKFYGVTVLDSNFIANDTVLCDSVYFDSKIVKAGTYNLTFEYLGTDSLTVFKVNRSITVDSIAEVLVFEELENEYCSYLNNQLVEASPKPGTKTQSKFETTLDSLNILTDNNLEDGIATFNFGNAIASKYFTDTFAISYIFSKTFGTNTTCSDTVTETIVINPRPVVDFFTNTEFNVVDTPFVLIGNPRPDSGFSSTLPGSVDFDGFNSKIDPGEAEGLTLPLNVDIKYTYADENGCRNDTTKTVTIKEPRGSIITIKEEFEDYHYCYYDVADTLAIADTTNMLAGTGYFYGPGLVDINNNPVDTLFGDTAYFSPAFATAKKVETANHTIKYDYLGKDATTLYTLEKVLWVDSIINELFFDESLQDAYCSYWNNRTIRAFPIPSTSTRSEAYFETTLDNLNILTDNNDGTAVFNFGNAISKKYYSGSFDISYLFKKDYGTNTECYDTVSESLIINPRPIVEFSTRSLFNVAEEDDTLIGNHDAGGVFSSIPATFVVDNKIRPSEAETEVPQAVEIIYTYTDSVTSCINDTFQNVTIQEAQGEIINTGANRNDFIFCFYEPSTRISIANVSNMQAGTGKFYGKGLVDKTNNSVDTVFGDTAYFKPSVAHVGTHQITFEYSGRIDNRTQFIITQDMTIDSVRAGDINLTINDLVTHYCDNDNNVSIRGNPQDQNGRFLLFDPDISDYTGTILDDNGDGTAELSFGDSLYGTYVVEYIYQEGSGINFCEDTVSQEFTIHEPPTPLFGNNTECIEDTITFIDSSKFLVTDSEQIVEWDWDLDDEITSISPDTSIKYTEIGAKVISLRVVSGFGCENTLTKNIEFDNKPIVDFSWINECEGDEVEFFNHSTNVGANTLYDWNFGDDNTSDALAPKHTYSGEGSYEVSLQAFTTFGCSNSITKTLHVRPYHHFSEVPSYFEDFEGGNKGWFSQFETSSVDSSNSWQLGTPVGPFNAKSGQNAWVTNLNGDYPNLERSYVLSPCFDFKETRRPMIQLDIVSLLDEGDGVVLSYITENHTSWQKLGTIGSGINWYNSFAIAAEPGGQPQGWSVDTSSRWIETRHALDVIRGKERVRFRLEFASDAAGRSEGFAFDDVWIGERARKVVIEHFTNQSDENSSAANDAVKNLVLANELDVIDLQYHTNYPGTDILNRDNPNDPLVRALYYENSAVPYAYMDGRTHDNYGSLKNLSNNSIMIRALTEPWFNLSINSTLSGQESINVEVEIQARRNITKQNIILLIVVFEKEVVINEDGNNVSYRNVVRKLLPSSGGILYSKGWIKNEKVTYSTFWNLNEIVIPDNIEIVAIMQNKITREIYQAAYNKDHLVEIPTGVDNNMISSTGDNSILLYPNPSFDKTNLLFEQPLRDITRVTIYNNLGEVMYIHKLYKGQTGMEINTHSWSKGMYLIRVQNNEFDKVLKLLKVK
ncbi:PKD domain-containing protein [Bacteroidota bacterium]